MAFHRESTGIAGLDEVLGGGLLANSSCLYIGRTGTGKTVSSLQWLHDARKHNARCLYISLSEPSGSLRRAAESFGWEMDHIEVLDLYPHQSGETLAQAPYNVFHPSEVEEGTIWGTVYETVREYEPDRVVLDSVTQLRFLSPDPYQFRKKVRELTAFLHEQGCTSILTFETSEHEQEPAVALAVDAVVHLSRRVSERRVIGLRYIEVEKQRHSGFMSGFHAMRISEKGVTVFPHRIEEPSDWSREQEQLGTGIEGLDAQLQGGLERGTSTIITGQSGVGKSTLGTQILRHAAFNGVRAVLYTFEESPGSIRARARSLNLPVDDLVEDGMMRIERINPIQLYPDEFLARLREAVEEDDRAIVMLDSLRGYDLAMAEFATAATNLHTMVSYLGRHNVSTIMTNEIEELSGPLVPTSLGVSYIADNILMLRYAESGGEIVRVVGCLKKRHGAFEHTLRRYDLSREGIQVSEPIRGVEGVLRGAPIIHKENGAAQ